MTNNKLKKTRKKKQVKDRQNNNHIISLTTKLNCKL